jgi:hypothetical protein
MKFPMADSITVRDFIYLDVELTRSLYAQLESGLIENTSLTKESAQATSGEISGKIPFFADAKTSGDLRWSKSETETRTLHDMLFNRVESRLRGSPAFLDLSSVNDAATECCHQVVAGQRSAAFFVIAGRIVFKDYRFLTKLVSDLHGLADTAAALSIWGQKQPAAKTAAARKKAEWTAAVSKEDVKRLRQVIEWMHGDRLVLQVRPSCDLERAFETDLEEKWLRFSRDTLRFRLGTHPAGEWRVFGQLVASGSPATELPAIADLDDMKAGLDTFFASLQPMVGISQVSAPIVSFVPIALYREVVV